MKCDPPRLPVVIVGAGGFAREVLNYALDCGWEVECFADLHDGPTLLGYPVRGLSNSALADRDVLVGLGHPAARRRIVESLPAGTRFPTLIHPSAYIGRDVEIAQGTIVCPHAVLTTVIRIGRYVRIDNGTTIGHDSVLGDFCACAPGVRISGHVHAAGDVYFGAGSVVLENLSICSNVTVGASACVVKSINEPGVYVGVPARPLPKR